MFEILKKFDDGNRTLIALSGSLTIENVKSCREFFAGLHEKRGVVAVDLGQIERADTAGLQLLLVLKKAAADRGYRIKYLNHSARLIRLAEIYGIAGLFGDRIVLPSGQKAPNRFRYGTDRQTF